MDIINKDYPDDNHVFFYDNTKTQTAHHPDAISTQYMTVKPPMDASYNFLCAVKDGDSTTHKVHMQDSHFLDGTSQ